MEPAGGWCTELGGLLSAEAVTRTVHSRAAACVAAGGGIFENQL